MQLATRPVPWDRLRAEVRLVEELAREYGFRLPRIDEDFVRYQAELNRHIAEVNHMDE